MITLELIQKMWFLITHPEKDASMYQANEIASISTPFGHPLLTIDVANLRHCLIPVADNSNAVDDKQSAGVHILINKWGAENKEKKFIDIVCLKPHLNSLFDIVIFEVLQLIENHSLTPEKASHDVLQKWRELLSREPSEIPDRKFIIGVLGELILLKSLITINANAVDYWLGPDGHRYDFYSGSMAIEVKTTTQKRGRLITIHGIDQLSYQKNTKLYLGVFRLEETPLTGITVSKIVQELISLGCNQTKLLMKLALLGISPEIIVKSDEFQYALVEQYFYEVDQSFPRITKESFKAGTFFEKIISLNYQVDLSSSPPDPLQAQEVLSFYNSFAKNKP